MKEELSTPERAAARLRYRFDAFLSTFRTKQVKGPPIIVFNAVSGAALMCVGMSEEDYAPSHFLVKEHARRYLAPTIDGNHRLAALYLSGAYTAPCSFVWSNLYPINQTRSACRVPSQGRPKYRWAGRSHRFRVVRSKTAEIRNLQLGPASNYSLAVQHLVPAPDIPERIRCS